MNLLSKLLCMDGWDASSLQADPSEVSECVLPEISLCASVNPEWDGRIM